MSQEDWKEGSDQVIFNANYLPLFMLATFNFCAEKKKCLALNLSHLRSLQKSLELLKADLIPLAFSLKTFYINYNNNVRANFIKKPNV